MLPTQSDQCIKVSKTFTSFGSQTKHSTHFISSRDKDHKRDNNKISTTSYTPALSILPDPYLPPPNRDNTLLWQRIMAAKKGTTEKKTTKATNKETIKDASSQYIASSHGAKGSPGYEGFIEMITGSELSITPAYRSQRYAEHFPEVVQDGTQTVKQYVTTFNLNTAKTFAEQFELWYSPCTGQACPRSESDLVRVLSTRIFPERWELSPTSRNEIPFDQGAIKQRDEYTSRFSNYSTSELRKRTTPFRYLRITQEQRLRGHDIANITDLPPAETDLRGRYDVIYALDSRCLPVSTRISALPCYDSGAQLCCIWLRLEYKIGEDEHSKRTARHQWSIGSYLELLERVRMKRIGNSYLMDPSSLSDIRQYGYVICGRLVEIWEMCVEVHKGCPKNLDVNQTIYEDDSFRFPIRLLANFNLTLYQEVIYFSH